MYLPLHDEILSFLVGCRQFYSRCHTKRRICGTPPILLLVWQRQRSFLRHTSGNVPTPTWWDSELPGWLYTWRWKDEEKMWMFAPPSDARRPKPCKLPAKPTPKQETYVISKLCYLYYKMLGQYKWLNEATWRWCEPTCLIQTAFLMRGFNSAT